jgi:hypothetical protein
MSQPESPVAPANNQPILVHLNAGDPLRDNAVIPFALDAGRRLLLPKALLRNKA